MSKPLVSVILPVYNAENTLAAAVRSILLQTLQEWELIILNDGSTDESMAIAKRFADPRIKICSYDRTFRLAARLNQAVSMARGTFIARMDADDIAYPERLSTQVCYLTQHPSVDLVGSRVLIFSGEGNIVGTYPFRQTHADICRRPFAGFYLPHPTWMGTREWFRHNTYSTSAVKAQDQELLLRTHETSRFACLPDFLLGYRKDELTIRTMLRGRFHFSRALLRKGLNEGRPILLWGLFDQLFKSLMDITAVGTGLNYRMLRHRALPVTKEAALKWHAVWKACN